MSCGNCGNPYNEKEFEHIILKACIDKNAIKKYIIFLKSLKRKRQYHGTH